MPRIFASLPNLVFQAFLARAVALGLLEVILVFAWASNTWAQQPSAAPRYDPRQTEKSIETLQSEQERNKPPVRLPGAPADLMVLDYHTPTPLNGENLAGHVVFGIGAHSVRDVIIGGEPVVRDRTLTRVDGAAIAAHAREQAARLWQRMAAMPAHEFEPRPRARIAVGAR